MVSGQPEAVRDVHRAPLLSRLGQGAFAGFLLVMPRRRLWRYEGPVTPLLSVAAALIAAGMLSGAVYYATDRWRAHGGGARLAAELTVLLVFAGASIGALALVRLLGII
jgi:hypothetical protein